MHSKALLDKSRFVFPLHIHISTLFIVVIIFFSSAQIILASRSINEVLLQANAALFDRVSAETRAHIISEYRPATIAVSTLARRDIVEAKTFTERERYFEEITDLIKLYQHITSYSVLYPDGSIFVTGIIEHERLKTRLKTPIGAEFFLINTDKNAPENDTVTFYNKDRKELTTIPFDSQKYLRLDRQWLSDSSTEKTVISEPHYYPAVDLVGITIHRKAKNGAIVAADLSLTKLQDVLNTDSISTSSLRLLYDEKETVYATNAKSIAAKILTHSDEGADYELLNTNDIDDDNIVTALNTIEVNQEITRYKHQGDDWYGKIYLIPMSGERTLRLLIAIKGDDLLKDAALIQDRAVILSIVISLISIPFVYYLSQRISSPIRQATENAHAISKFDFSVSIGTQSNISEIRDLANSVATMKSAIHNYYSLTHSLSKETNFGEILGVIGSHTIEATEANAAYLYLIDDTETMLVPQNAWNEKAEHVEVENLISLSLDDERLRAITDRVIYDQRPFESITLTRNSTQKGSILGDDEEGTWTLTFPLFDRTNTTIGAMVLVFDEQRRHQVLYQQLDYFESLMNYTAIALDGRKMLHDQKALLESFIQVVASAIDTKSPYTGNHCQRVPVLTLWLAKAAEQSTKPEFQDFKLTENEWEELQIAAWLHDCGKVTTPEYIIDKATKLETIYNRIHEVRMRFEVMKRDVELDIWKQQYQDGLSADNINALHKEWQRLDEEFALLAESNIGGEALSEETKQAIHNIGKQTWKRTIDNRLGLSEGEKQRLESTPTDQLPQHEPLLQDHTSHVISREKQYESDERFTMKPTEYKNNLGELYNLTISRGTLNCEERFTINDHIVQTITMLEALPFPRTLKRIPEIAGGHHERMDGEGYPMGIKAGEMLLTARMVAIADIFEALTSVDRPYKRGKTLSESLSIMKKMVVENHIDGDLFRLFLTSGLYLKYSKEYLSDAQCDEVDINDYLI